MFVRTSSTRYSDCMIFLSSFLDVTRMSISTVSFLAELVLILGLKISEGCNNNFVEFLGGEAVFSGISRGKNIKL